MFFESIAIILITTPILLPTMIALDIDLIWYGVLLMINLEPTLPSIEERPVLWRF